MQVNGSDIVPLYNIVPPSGSPAQFGFFYLSIVVTLLAKVRPSDYGIDIVTEETPSSIPIPKFEVTMWGVPSDRSHDQLREVCLERGSGYNPNLGDCSLETAATCRSCARRPRVRAPAAVGASTSTPTSTRMSFHSETTTPAIEGCEYNPFDPTLALAPSTQAPHAPSGVDARSVDAAGLRPQRHRAG